MQSLRNLIYCYNIGGQRKTGCDIDLSAEIQTHDLWNLEYKTGNATHLTMTLVHMLPKQYWLGDWLNRQRFSHVFRQLVWVNSWMVY
jgi:hypothetical protein